MFARFDESEEKNNRRMEVMAQQRRNGHILAPSEKITIKHYVQVHHDEWRRVAKMWCRRRDGINIMGEIRIFYWWRGNLGFIDKSFMIQRGEMDFDTGFSVDPETAKSEEGVIKDGQYGRIG
jgi:hypothetical protein